MSFCDIEKLANDIKNHPNFINRLEKWKSGPNGINGCQIGYKTDKDGCLTEEEVACYTNYVLSSKRAELDTSLRLIYQPQIDRYASFDSTYNATMLTGVIWAMLGTTILYYTFTKM